MKAEMDARGIRVVAATGWGTLHKAEAWPETERWFREIAACHAEAGAEYIVHLPPMYRDEKTGEFLDDRTLTAAAWNSYIDNANKLGRIMKCDYGLQMVLHPHGDSHIETREDIDRIFQATDPEYVGFCLDTGHIVYGGGDNVDLINTYQERINYVHIKAMDPGIVNRAHDEDWSFVKAVTNGCSVAPPAGEPDMPSVIDALAALAVRDLRAGHVRLRQVLPQAGRDPHPRISRRMRPRSPLSRPASPPPDKEYFRCRPVTISCWPPAGPPPVMPHPTGKTRAAP
jgi:inosose dehydratase